MVIRSYFTQIFLKWRDPVSALTHLFALICAMPASLMLVTRAFISGDVVRTVSLAVFSASMMLLYYASASYHMENSSEKKIKSKKKFDHAMIFIFIAGSYTPVCAVCMGAKGYGLLAFVWSVAILGMICELLGKSLPRIFSTVIYVVLGWAIVSASQIFVESIPGSGILLLFLGGLSYTVGAVVYAAKKPVIDSVWFGSHEIFHVFVMIGSLLHTMFMFAYV